MNLLNSKIKILFVHGNSDIVAGQEISLLNRIKGLTEKGVKSVVAVSGNGIFFNLLRENNIEVRNLTLRRIRKINPLPFLRTVFQVYRLINQEKISIVHCSGAYPNQYCLPAARLARIPCVVHVNSTIYTRADFLKSFINYADAIIAVSDAVKNHIINSLGISSEKVIVSYNGLKIKKIFDAVEFTYLGINSGYVDNKENIRQRFHIGGEVKVVGLLAQIIPRKGLEYFIKMASIVKDSLPNTKFLIVGSAPAEYSEYELEQRRLVENFGLNEDVIFTGFQTDISSIIEILDVSVLCSLEEGLGRVIIESMALGKPVVGTLVGGIPEIITDNQTGFLVPPKDPEALAEAVLKLLKDPQMAEMMGTAGKTSIAKKFNSENHTNAIINIYNSLLSKKNKKHFKQKVNILYFEPSPGFGGSVTALVHTLNALDRNSLTPTVIVKNFGEKLKTLKDTEFIKFKDYHGELDKLTNFKFLFYFLNDILPEVFRIYFISKAKKISLIHINTNITLGIPAILAAKLLSIPCVCHIRETRKLIRREKLFSKWVGKFIVLNNDALGLYKQYIPEDKINVIFDGLDLDGKNIEQRGSFKSEFNLNSNPVIGAIGRIVDGKGQREFVLAAKEALKLRPQVRFAIVGDAKGSGSSVYCNEVIDLIREDGLQKKIIFTGWRSDVNNIIADLDVLVLPSTTFPEGLPNSIIEAMALRKPVIATDIPGPRDIVVNGETGFLVPPVDIKAMSEKMVFFIDNPNIAKKMGEAGRKRAEELFDIKKQVKKIEAVYEEVLNADGRG